MKAKKLIVAGAVVLGVLVIGMLVVAGNLGGIIHRGIEGFGPQVTQTSLKLKGVSVSILGGSAELRGLVLGNPTGYKQPDALEADRIAVRLSPGSIRSDKVIIHSIVVEGAHLHVEGSPSDNNFTRIQSNVESFIGGGAKTDTGPAKKLQVDELVLKDCKLDLTMGLLGGKSVTVPLPEVRLTQLGQGPEGITPGELVNKVISSLTGNIGSAATQAVKDVGGAVTDAVKGLGKGAAEGVDKTTKGIKSLFNKKE